MYYVQPNQAGVDEGVSVFRAGGVIVYPTDTVYGLGADATNSKAVELVRTIKGRDAAKSILALVADRAMLEQYAEVTPLAARLAGAFWPGPLSLVLTVRNDTLASIASTDGSAGFRMPNHAWCTALVAAYGRPITSTSVNRSGRAQPKTLPDMLDQLGIQADRISLVVDAGTLPVTAPSTIVDARGDTPLILREGTISRDNIVRCM